MIFRKCTQFSVCLRGDGTREGLVWLGSVETSVIVIKRVNGHWKQMQRQQSNKSLWIHQIPKNNWMHLIFGIPFRIHRSPSRWPSPLPNWNQHSHTMHSLSMSFVFLTVPRRFSHISKKRWHLVCSKHFIGNTSRPWATSHKTHERLLKNATAKNGKLKNNHKICTIELWMPMKCKWKTAQAIIFPFPL